MKALCKTVALSSIISITLLHPPVLADDTPEAPAAATNWRNSLPKFCELLSAAIKQSKIIDPVAEMGKIRDHIAFTNAEGQQIWALFDQGFGKELHGVVARPSGKVSWEGVVAKVESDPKEGVQIIDVTLPFSGKLPAAIELRRTLGLRIPMSELPSSELPKVGETFQFRGALEKEKSDALLPPIWVMYGLGPNRGKILMGVSLTGVEPVR